MQYFDSRNPNAAPEPSRQLSVRKLRSVTITTARGEVFELRALSAGGFTKVVNRNRVVDGDGEVAVYWIDGIVIQPGATLVLTTTYDGVVYREEHLVRNAVLGASATRARVATTASTGRSRTRVA